MRARLLRTLRRSATLAAAALLLGTQAARSAGPRASCHIHPPEERIERGDSAGTIGPYATLDACEAARVARFGARGRCHCTTSFAGGRLPWPRPVQAGRPGEVNPGDAPLP
jgi:hypothetical protein